MTLSAPSSTLDSTGATSSVAVTTEPECAWTASADGNWISGLTPVSGQGSGRVAFQVPANPTPAMRQGSIVVNGSAVVVQQEGAACRYTIDPASDAVPASGGTINVRVSALSGCMWTASSPASWITIASSGGNGDGAAAFTVAANTGQERSVALSVAGQTVTVTQSAAPAPCVLSLSPRSVSIATTGGQGPAVVVETADTCTWTVTTDVSWVTITSDTSGRGAGRVTYSVAANSGGPRSATLTIGGETVVIDQAGADACTYTVAPTAQTIGATGGAGGPFTVTTTAGCEWAATSAVGWITVASGVRTGAGSVGITVATNIGAARTGTLSIAGRTVTVTQAAATSTSCSYAVAPVTQSIGASGGTGTPIAVTTAAGCNWTATSGAPWITIATGASGSGDGLVSIAVAANNDNARTGTLTVAGQTAAVTQAAAAPPAPPSPSCSFSVNPTHDSIGAAGGRGTTISVSTNPGCAWTATSDVPWISIVSGAGGEGNGNGTVAYVASPNTGAQRSGTLNVGGVAVTISQASGAPPCQFSIGATSQAIGAGGGAGTPVAVTTRSDCAWTASSHAAWLTITSGSSGTGNGSVAFTAAANSGIQRTGTLTVAGQTFTVTQAAACTYSIAPTGQSIASSGGIGTPVAVTTAANCAWTTSSNSGWLTVTSGVTGTGNGTVAFFVAANIGGPRTGTLTIAGQPFTVMQSAGAGCAYSISPTNQSMGTSGGAGNPITVTTTPGCTWTATSNAPWLTVTSGASGADSGSVTFTAAANTGLQRTGTLTIAGLTFMVTQAGPCSSAINPTAQTIGAAGGAGTSIAVTAGTGCTWTATSNAPWLTITAGASGSGNGSVGFFAAANTGAQRTGTLTVANQTFTVTQSAAPPPCSFSISPSSQRISRAGGSGTPVSVTAGSGCAWTATSNVSWITITSGATGSGNGTVNFTVQSLASGNRNGTLTIAGQTFTVDQSGGGGTVVEP